MEWVALEYILSYALCPRVWFGVVKDGLEHLGDGDHILNKPVTGQESCYFDPLCMVCGSIIPHFLASLFIRNILLHVSHPWPSNL